MSKQRGASKENTPKKLNIICPWCNAPYTAEMIADDLGAGGCDTCGPEVYGAIDIICTNCKKLVYRKEI